MTVLAAILKILWTVAAAVMVVTVLLHAAKGDGVAAIGGQAQLFASQKSAEKNLDRVTWGATALFLALSALLSTKAFTGALGNTAAPLASPLPISAPPATSTTPSLPATQTPATTPAPAK